MGKNVNLNVRLLVHLVVCPTGQMGAPMAVAHLHQIPAEQEAEFGRQMASQSSSRIDLSRVFMFERRTDKKSRQKEEETDRP